ncbi:spore germination protein [Solibacillus sp. CAU 1738]|uniref:spore germination protein n=1 Tax=Solibacillus sp. CAU 1738 TaxID=3140363 RepID=UPI0032600682
MESTNKTIDINIIKQLFQKSADIQFQEYTFKNSKVYFITCEAMIDGQLFNEVIVPNIQQLCESNESESLEKAIESGLHIPDIKKIGDKEELITSVYRGNLLLYFEDEQLLYSSNISKKPNRNPEETKLEVMVKGPRDNFIEDIAVNIALIRKRAPTNSLCVEKMEIGKRSKTSVAILYFDDIANKDILNQIKKQMANIDTDIIVSGDSLMERINKDASLFPRTNYTGRADFALQSLVRGRFLIFVDGVAYGVIVPINLFFLLKTGEDSEYPLAFSSVERLLRIVGLLIGMLLPAFWLALTTFHQNQLPLQLLATIVLANTGLPLPTAMEMLIMLGMFELFREAGLRLPSVIAGTISVVGGLIVGDAAIRAGITSPAMVVIIAISTIATFTLVNQSLVTAVSLVRVIFILMTAALGLFGFFISIYFLLVYLSSIRTFGVPYMDISTDLKWSTISKSLFRMPSKSYKERPTMLKTKDKTRSKD